MSVKKARQKWKDVFTAAQKGDPAEMFDAAQLFSGIAETMFIEWEKPINVRKLVWIEDEQHAMGYRENAECPMGVYWVENHENSGEWRVYFDGYPDDIFISSFDTEDEAKECAQDHFDAIISGWIELKKRHADKVFMDTYLASNQE